MTITPDNVIDVIRSIQNDGSASLWVKQALSELLNRDPVDAANDVEVLNQVIAAYNVRLYKGAL